MGAGFWEGGQGEAFLVPEGGWRVGGVVWRHELCESRRTVGFGVRSSCRKRWDVPEGCGEMDIDFFELAVGDVVDGFG